LNRNPNAEQTAPH
jgi:putative transposase